MKGSEKQIKWAEEIIEDWKSGIDNLVDTARLRVEDGSMPKLWLDVCESGREKAFANMSKIENAAAVIQIDKQRNMVDMAEKLMIADYEAAK